MSAGNPRLMPPAPRLQLATSIQLVGSRRAQGEHPRANQHSSFSSAEEQRLPAAAVMAAGAAAREIDCLKLLSREEREQQASVRR